MTTTRRAAAADGQRSTMSSALRSRDTSGIPIGQQPLKFLRLLDELSGVLTSIGPPCWAYGHTAAALLGFDGYKLTKPFDLVVPANRAPHRLDHTVHRVQQYSQLDITTAYGVPCQSATRTLIELARTETPRRLTTALDSAVRDGLTTDDFLHRRLNELRTRGRPGPAKLLQVIAGAELSRGGESWLERVFLELLGELGFPRPLTQQVVARRGRQMIRVDCCFAGTNIVIELLGYRYHRSPMQMQADAERLNRLQLDGFLAVQFTYVDVVSRSERMLSTLSELRIT